jgi:hypothetical protein
MTKSDSSMNYLEIMSSGIAIIVPAGFVISVIYDWGFLYALNLGFRDVPTTITDHFRTGLVWFPYLIALVIAYYAIEFQFQRVERGLTEEEIVSTSKNPERLKKFREGPYKLLTWMAPLGVLNFLMIGDAVASIFPLFLSITWISFAGWCYSAPLIQIRRSRFVQLAFTLLPVIVIIAFFSGYNNAVEAAQSKPIHVNVHLSVNNENIEGKILRSFDKGVMVMSPEETIKYIPWSQIKLVENKDKYVPFRGFILKYLNRPEKVESTAK